MLGRQQIAGVPTALHELLKNAHDAYADKVRIDYFPDKNLLAIRDDGFGMTLDDYENRWLALGTESKLTANDLTRPVWTGPKNLPRRAILGAKGIGRLAIAAIGPQVLIISRAIRPDGAHKTVLGFINWTIFEQPGLDLNNIDVPILELDEKVPAPEDLMLVRDYFKSSIEGLKSELSQPAYQRILREIDQYQVDVFDLISNLEGPDLSSDTGGTYFLIQPTNVELDLDLMISSQLGSISTIQKYLLGFSNTMRKGSKAAPVTAEFWHHSGGEPRELIGPHSFFTPDEFEKADHHFEGGFDETGVFRGKVRIYDEVEYEYTLSPPPEFTGTTKCGPFRVNIAYVQGRLVESRMDEEDWKEIVSKLDAFGGVYIYRDGVRILPYGNNDYDWLHIEHRRTLSARDWFFSYRRMTGCVEISAADNEQLKEKAGREGFRENLAYRQLRSLLENLLQQLAIDYFRGDDAKVSTVHHELRTERQRAAEIRKKHDERTRKKRKDFKEAISVVKEDLDNGLFHEVASAIIEQFNAAQGRIRAIKNPLEAGKEAVAVENTARTQVEALTKKMEVPKPRGFQPSKVDNKAYVRLEAAKSEFIENVLKPLEATIGEVLEELVDQGLVEFSSTDRYLAPVYERADEALSAANKLRNRIRASLEGLQEKTRENVNGIVLAVSKQLEEVKVDTHKTVQNLANEDVLVSVRNTSLDRVRAIHEDVTTRLEDVYQQLEALDLSGDIETSHLSVVEALEGHNIELMEKLEKFSEWAQVGMALGVVQHEFSGHSRNLYRGLQRLKPWAKQSEGLTEIYNELVTSFQHLESYLQLFLPMDRRMQRSAIDISGYDIEKFVRAIFGDQLAGNDISLVITPAFQKYKINSYPSCILPVFVNLVDNAIYWLTRSDAGKRTIVFDVRKDDIRVTNSGPGIDVADVEDIFEFGFSTKPNGTGIGMAVSREILNQIDMNISLENVGVQNAPTFVISKQL
nr:ATP-binding protein [Kordiimonas marina]